MVGFDDVLSQSPCIIVPGEKIDLIIDNWSFRTDFAIEDNRTGETKRVTALILHVLSEDGVRCDKPWNLISKKAMAELRPHIEDRTNLPIKLSVLKHMGEGFPTYQITILERGVKL